jgi:FkbM family methyltransferase
MAQTDGEQQTDFYMDIEKLLSKFIENVDGNIFFIQIGANDGAKKDHIVDFIKKYQWHGILVEPVPYLFEKLKATYIDYDLHFENAAITTQNGFQPIYRLSVDGSALPEWHDGLASLDKNIVLSHADSIPEIESLVVNEMIRTLTFTSLLDKYDIEDVNILHIDTEGHDYEILKTINFDRIRPNIIIYEYHHLTLYNYQRSTLYLQNNGYTVYHSHNSFDILAVDKLVLS